VIVYRIQPAGLELGDHCSETSNGNPDRGVHVCQTIEQIQAAVRGWCKWSGSRPELVEIECDAGDVRDNGDYEGWVLIGNRGTIVSRKSFRDGKAMARWSNPD
jgi:hypothetical protein